MIRGSAVLIMPNNQVLVSGEYNGGMDLGQFGQTFLERFSLVEDEAQFRKFIEDFNNEFQQHPGGIGVDLYEIDEFVSQSNIERRSDYLYIKNASGEGNYFTDGQNVYELFNGETYLRSGDEFIVGNNDIVGSKDDIGELKLYDDDNFVDDDIDNEHIAEQIKKGYTSGQLTADRRWTLTKE